MPDDVPLKAAVVGVGHLGRHHARLMGTEVPGARLVAIVDPNAALADEIAAGLGVPRLDSIDELPADVQVASVAAPTTLHHRLSCDLLERGIHVLVEKPMAATLQEAEAMAALAAKNGLVLQVGHIERFNPVLAALREQHIEPRFIEAHRLAPFNYRTLDVSVIMDLMIHDLDIVMELAGGEPVRIDAVGSPILGKNVDLANARLTFANGCVANVTASRVSFEPLRKTRLYGRDAFASLDFATRRAFIVTPAEGFDLGSITIADVERLPLKDSFKDYVSQGILDLREIDMDAGNPLQIELATFIAAARGLDTRGVPASDGLRAMRAAEQIADTIAASQA